jgi:hypothetical protein
MGETMTESPHVGECGQPVAPHRAQQGALDHHVGRPHPMQRPREPGARPGIAGAPPLQVLSPVDDAALAQFGHCLPVRVCRYPEAGYHGRLVDVPSLARGTRPRHVRVHVGVQGYPSGGEWCGAGDHLLRHLTESCRGRIGIACCAFHGLADAGRLGGLDNLEVLCYI